MKIILDPVIGKVLILPDLMEVTQHSEGLGVTIRDREGSSIFLQDPDGALAIMLWKVADQLKDHYYSKKRV